MDPVELVNRCQSIGLLDSRPTQSTTIRASQQQYHHHRPTKRADVCPDRGRFRFKISQHPPPVGWNLTRSHCTKCLNDNLVSTSAVNRVLPKLLSSVCTVCCVRWCDIDEKDTRVDRQLHKDEHIREASRKLSIATNNNARRLDRKTVALETRVLLDYNKQLLRKSNSKKPYKKFTDIPIKTRRMLMSKLMDKYQRSCQNDVTAPPVIDDRPHIDMSANVRRPLFDTVDGYNNNNQRPVSLEESTLLCGTVNAITQGFAARSSTHILYEVSPTLTYQLDWGRSRYHCFLCRKEIDLDTDDDLCMSDAHFCTCAPRDDTHQHREEGLGVDEEVDRSTALLGPHGQPATLNFVFNSDGRFSAYAIHSKCCSAFVV